MITDPFADLQLSPDLLTAANNVRNTMSQWIDTQVASLKTQLSAKAGIAASQVATQAQDQLAQVLQTADVQLQNIESNLAALKVGFTDAGLKAQSDRLQAVIADSKAAVAAQKARLQEYGQAVGGVIQKALVSAL
jgi:hypothetical protein